MQKQQGLEFRETLHYLAEKAGVPVEDDSGSGRSAEEEREASAVKERLRQLNEDALLWFHQMLLRSKEGSVARTYIQERGISTDSVVSFGLGYAPESWDGLSRYLLGRGYTERELVSGGLARERNGGLGVGGESGGVYDYFRHRLIFPIRDMRGRVIGFGGRAFGDDKPKYLNSPQTVLFEKNSVLYALDLARDAIKQAKQVVIVEGYVDAVIAHQYGTKQTVACIGSAITEKHIQQLKKLTRQVTLALDPDAAGEAATEHGIQEALKTFDRRVVPVPLGATPSGQSARNPLNAPGMIRLEEQVDGELNVLQLPEGQDPDEVIIHNFAVWTYAVAHPVPLMDYYFAAKTSGLDLKRPADKAEAAKRLLPLIGLVPDRIKREDYTRKLAAMIKVDERSVRDELQLIIKGQKSNGSVAQFSAPTKQRQATKDAQGVPAVDAHMPGQRSSGVNEDEPPWVNDKGSREKKSTAQGQSSWGLDRRKENKLQWEDYLIGLLLLNPGLSQNVCGIINDGDFAGTDTRELYHLLNSISQRGSSSLHEPLEQAVPSVLLATVERARQSVELRSPEDGEGLVKDAVQCATRLKRTRLLQLNTELRYALHEAESTSDVAAVQQLMRKLLANQQQLRTIDVASRLQG